MKKIRLIQLLFLSLFLIGTYLPTQAQKIDTISVYSTSMKKQIKNIKAHYPDEFYNPAITRLYRLKEKLEGESTTE